MDYSRDLTHGIEKIDRHFSLQALRDLGELEKTASGRIPFFENLNSYHQIVYGAFRNTNTELSEANYLTEVFSKSCKKSDQNFSMFTARMCKIFSTRNIALDKTTITEINKQLGTNFTLDYSSHEDGWETEGVKLEQWRSKGIYSEFTEPYVTVVHVNGTRSEQPCERDNVLANHPDSIMLDLEAEKLYVAGKPVTSKEIKTQSVTLRLLEKLVQSKCQEVSSKELPTSSYTRDKSETASKIVSPLKKLVKDRTGADFPLQIRGNSGNFTIKLEPCGVPVVLIEKR